MALTDNYLYPQPAIAPCRHQPNPKFHSQSCLSFISQALESRRRTMTAGSTSLHHLWMCGAQFTNLPPSPSVVTGPSIAQKCTYIGNGLHIRSDDCSFCQVVLAELRGLAKIKVACSHRYLVTSKRVSGHCTDTGARVY